MMIDDHLIFYFQECISKSAVKTKFEQHTQQGKAVSHALKNVMDCVNENANKAKSVFVY